jgi:hypothetical protein
VSYRISYPPKADTSSNLVLATKSIIADGLFYLKSKIRISYPPKADMSSNLVLATSKRIALKNKISGLFSGDIATAFF